MSASLLICWYGVLRSQLDLESNQLCGIDQFGEGTFNAEGIIAICDALRVNGSLTMVSAQQPQEWKAAVAGGHHYPLLPV